MSKLKFCVGKRAKKPYHISQARLRIFSMEELCYFLCEYAGLLDESLLSDELIDWIDTECGMRELALQLYKYAHFNKSVHTFAYTILTAVAYKSEAQIKEICKRIEQYETLDVWQRKKTQADELFRNGQYLVALESYQRILLETAEKEPLSDALKADICHNMGCVLADLFYFKQAAVLFQEAYVLGGYVTDQVYECACMRFALGEEGYAKWVSEKHVDAQVQGQLTTLFATASQQFELTPEHEEFMQADRVHDKQEGGAYDAIVDDMMKRVTKAFYGYTNL